MSTRDRFATPSHLREGAWADRWSSEEASRTLRQVPTRSDRGTLPPHLSGNEIRNGRPLRRRFELGLSHPYPECPRTRLRPWRCPRSLHAHQRGPPILLTVDRAGLSLPSFLLLSSNALQSLPRLQRLSDPLLSCHRPLTRQASSFHQSGPSRPTPDPVSDGGCRKLATYLRYPLPLLLRSQRCRPFLQHQSIRRSGPLCSRIFRPRR